MTATAQINSQVPPHARMTPRPVMLGDRPLSFRIMHPVHTRESGSEMELHSEVLLDASADSEDTEDNEETGPLSYVLLRLTIKNERSRSPHFSWVSSDSELPLASMRINAKRYASIEDAGVDVHQIRSAPKTYSKYGVIECVTVQLFDAEDRLILQTVVAGPNYEEVVA